MTLKWQKDPEYLALVEDLLDHELVQKLEMYKHHHVTNRLLHSLSVSYRSYRWAKRLKLNTKAIARAVNIASIPLDKPESESPDIVSLIAFVNATPGTKYIIAPIIILSTSCPIPNLTVI